VLIQKRQYLQFANWQRIGCLQGPNQALRFAQTLLLPMIFSTARSQHGYTIHTEGTELTQRNTEKNLRFFINSNSYLIILVYQKVKFVPLLSISLLEIRENEAKIFMHKNFGPETKLFLN
jgi:hypothetical protein